VFPFPRAKQTKTWRPRGYPTASGQKEWVWRRYGAANVPQTLLNGISMIFDANHVVLDYATGDYRAKVLGPPYSAARASGLSVSKFVKIDRKMHK